MTTNLIFTPIVPRVRLVGGDNSAEGRVEISINGTWGTICDDFWGATEASVTCRSLGYLRATEVTCCSQFGVGSAEIILDDVICLGHEDNLLDCRHGGIGQHNCGNGEHVGVVCTNTSKFLGMAM